jgi:hypothetical protein
MDKCLVCGTPAQIQSVKGDFCEIDCPRCGAFKLTDIAEGMLLSPPLHARQVANASGFLRENPGHTVDNEGLQRLRSLATPTVTDKAEKVLSFLSRRFPSPGQRFECRPDRYLQPDGKWTALPESHDMKTSWLFHHELLARAWAADGQELRFIVGDYLCIAKRYLSLVRTEIFVISTDGWAHLESNKPNTESPFVFVAMNFDPSLTFLFDEAIEPALKEAGYRALRIDRHEHVNRIDDEIIAQLRKSRFCVADFTGQKAGVYFEAGFALGFKLPVIWSARHDDVKNVHFDTRQYNLLLWERDDLVDFKNRLKNRVEAIIGRGPGI